MKKIINILGSIMFTAIMYSVPIVIACAFYYHWELLYRLLSVGCGLIQCVYIFLTVYYKVEADD